MNSLRAGWDASRKASKGRAFRVDGAAAPEVWRMEMASVMDRETCPLKITLEGKVAFSRCAIATGVRRGDKRTA